MDNIDKQAITHAANLIRNGELVAFPTETVYGLGANALNPIAVAKIFEAKKRPFFDPLIVHIANFEQLYELSTAIDEHIEFLVRSFWPGPLTIVLPKNNNVPDIVTSGLQTVGVRMPNNAIALDVIRQAGCPIAAPSANTFGNLSPTCARHVRKQLPDIYTLDGGNSQVGVESTIVHIENRICTILRPGIITIEDIEAKMPGIFTYKPFTGNTHVSPGLLKSHYSPKKPLHIISADTQTLPPHSGIIVHHATATVYNACAVEYTSHTANLYEVAAHLFASLHALEDNPLIQQIYIEPLTAEGLGIAIMDRIQKAAYKYSHS